VAVYTEVTAEDVQALLALYDIGALTSFKGIAEGVENSNYFLGTDRGQYILTLYEKRVNARDLPFFLGLMEHVAQCGVPCPIPVHDREGAVLQSVSGKSAALVTFLSGYSLRKPAPSQCKELGATLANFHNASLRFELSRPNALSLAGWTEMAVAAQGLADTLCPGLEAQIARELKELSTAWPESLPHGVIHADLFPDNVLFLNDKVSGVIDFYFACNDILTYDTAICMNAWCFEPDHSFNVTKARAMLKDYNSVRKLSGDEVAALPILARGAALRFLLTRLLDWFNTPDTALVKRKDPLEYWKKLQFHQGIRSASGYGF